MDAAPMDVDTKPALYAHPSPAPKTPVVRGARACTVCRAAKMKCVGAEDGQKQCQRCKRANVECVFEKHRRGRKPGSKLSDASKMLRRLEKGLNIAKTKAQSSESTSPYYHNEDLRVQPPQDSYATPSASRSSDQPYSATNSHFPPPQLSPQPYQSPDPYQSPANGSRSVATEDEKDDFERSDEPLFPAKLIQENKRNSFFRTILNPDTQPSAAPRNTSYTPPPNNLTPSPVLIPDPISTGIVTEKEVHDLFDAVFLRLNPFINLFDPTLHTVAYVRSRCPFLFTVLVMAGCKFFIPEKFKECQKLAQDLAVRAFAEDWKRVEVVQAFACLTYWKDPTDNRTWTYIGYACRMAVELGLNRYIAHSSPSETDFQRLERRNRERTYLVLFVHDRSLSMQTGRNWMLPEDDLIRHAVTWHEASTNTAIRPEDVIIAAFVALRRIAAETTDLFNTAKGQGANANSDINYEHVLAHCNVRLTQWDQMWRKEMEKARGEKFHFSFLSFFRLHVRLFLNSFGIQAAMQPHSRQPPSLQALTMCCTSALESLHIVSEDFHGMKLLRYGQESITVMTAYSAIFLLKLLRTPNTGDQLGVGRDKEIHALIRETADSYEDASRTQQAPLTVSTAAQYHARFLRSLVEHDEFESKKGERERNDSSMPIDPRLQVHTGITAAAAAHNALQQASSATATVSAAAAAAAAAQAYAHQVHTSRMQEQPPQQFHFPASPHLPAHPHQVQAQSLVQAVAGPEYQGDMQPRSLGNVPAAPGHTQYPGGYIPPAPQTTELDQRYWKNMFLELGFGDNDAPLAAMSNMQTQQQQQMYMEQQQQQHQQQQQQQQQHQQQHQQHQQQHQRHASFGGPGHVQSQMQYQVLHAAATHQAYGH